MNGRGFVKKEREPVARLAKKKAQKCVGKRKRRRDRIGRGQTGRVVR